MAAAWVCTACKRRVPGYIEVCHCGAGRPAPGSAPTAPDAPVPRLDAPVHIDLRQVPWQVWLAVGVMGLTLLAGVASLLIVPHRPEPTVPLLGYVDRVPAPAPRPPQKAKPKPRPAASKSP